MEDLIQRLRSEIADSTIKVDAANGAHARAAAATRAAVAQAGASGDRKLELLHDAAQREEAWALGHYQHLKNINEQLLEDQSLLMASLPGPGKCALLLACNTGSVLVTVYSALQDRHIYDLVECYACH